MSISEKISLCLKNISSDEIDFKYNYRSFMMHLYTRHGNNCSEIDCECKFFKSYFFNKKSTIDLSMDNDIDKKSKQPL